MLEVNAEGDLHYFVLEFVDGSNLLDYLKERGRLSEARRGRRLQPMWRATPCAKRMNVASCTAT